MTTTGDLTSHTGSHTGSKAASSAATAQPAGTSLHRPVMFFDGVCGLCNRSVDFVIARDKREVFRFAPLQGTTAKENLSPSDVESLGSFVLLDEQGIHRRSSAVVRVLRRLGGFWSALGTLLWLIPKPLREVGYKLVARFRYTLFGKKETCRMPKPEERARFLP